MKIYTRVGDKGRTSLLGGEKVSKDHERLRAYGSVDELNAQIGLARSLDETGELDDALLRIQENLFVIGSQLAAPDPAAFSLPALPEGAVAELEGWIDTMEADLPALKNFILPGGCPQGAALHLARTVCRRTERAIVALAAAAELSPGIFVFLNRLSDFLFVAARWANRRAGRGETLWQPRREDKD